MYRFVGRTFDHKDRLRDLGARWNADARAWEKSHLTDVDRDIISRMVGVVIVDGDADGVSSAPVRPRPKPTVDNATLIRRLMEANARKPSGITSNNKTAFYGDDQEYYNHFADQNPKAYFGFSSLSKMIEYIKSVPDHFRTHEAWHDGEADFRGTETMQQAFDIAKYGWSDGVELAEEIHQKLVGTNALQRRRKYSVAGGSVNVGKMLAGNPKHMVARPKQSGRRVTTLIIDASMMAFIEAKYMIIRAGMIGAISDILEANGYSCEIIIVDNANLHKSVYQHIVTKLKAAGEPLNLNDLIFAMGHPSYLRRFCFACVNSAPECRDIWESMGVTGTLFDVDHMPTKNELYIRGLDHMDQLQMNDEAPLLVQAMKICDLIIDDKLPITLNRED